MTLGNPDAKIKIEAWTENVTSEGKTVITIHDADKNVVASTETEVAENHLEAELTIKNVSLWDGLENPYLYTVTVQLFEMDKAIDEIDTRFGCRTYSVDPEKGFFLNGRSYPLCGVARHQDRRDAGNALTKEMHREDMDIICELGANTIRLAHYQHDQYFYDLCDERGLIVWAEIPYITEHMPEGRENTILSLIHIFYILIHAAAFGYFSTDSDRPNADVLALEEGHFENGIWIPGRRLNGDEVVNTMYQEPTLLKLKLFAYL